jgi:CcmD family protein
MQATPPAAAPPPAPQSVPAAQDEFVPISELPADEQIPAAPLLIAAYALVWIILAVYVWTLWRRFQRAEQDVKRLASRLPPAG